MTADEIDALVKKLSLNFIDVEYSTIVPQTLLDMMVDNSISLLDLGIVLLKLPRTKNPFYMPLQEVKVLCSQGHSYIVHIRGFSSIPDISGWNEEECPICAEPIQKWKTLMGHSGGTFNCMKSRSENIAL